MSAFNDLSGDESLEGVRRKAILSAANELLGEKGLEGLTIRAVLERSGLARRAFYDLFQSKDDLMLAVFDHTLADAARQLGQQAAELASPSERLRLIVFTIITSGAVEAGLPDVSAAQRSAAFSQEHLRLAQVRPQELERAITPLIELIRLIIQDGVEQGVMRSNSPRCSARLVYNLVSTTAHTGGLDSASRAMSSDSRMNLAEDVWDFCRNGLVR